MDTSIDNIAKMDGIYANTETILIQIGAAVEGSGGEGAGSHSLS